MYRLACLFALLLAAAGFVIDARAADLSIMPVAIHLDRGHDRTTVSVTNNGNAPAVLQAGAIAWHRDGGVDRDEPSEDLIVNPSVFRLAPGKTQIVRIGVRRNSEADHETTYRMVLTEVPSPDLPDAPSAQGNVRVLVTLRVPVYVAPAAVKREERWHARWDDQGQLVAQVTNAGNVHYKVGAVRLQGEDVRNAVVAQGPESVIFPGEARSYKLPPRVAAGNQPPQPLTLEVLTDRGVQYVALDLAPR